MPAMSLGDLTFGRGTDLLAMGEKAAARDVVNVLGRWSSYKQWEAVGELPAMDRLFDQSGREVKKLASQQPTDLLAPKKGNGEWVMKTPQRRGFCLRNGLVQRYWFAQNVGLLPFRSKPLAASLGCSVSELNALPVSPLAVQVVFDALSRSQSGILQRELCDERRASYEDDGGGFDAAAFAADIAAARLTIVRSLCIFPGSVILVQVAVFFKLDGMNQGADYLAKSQSMAADNAALWAAAFGLH